jgi:mono/diheme cytochrome c family protein
VAAKIAVAALTFAISAALSAAADGKVLFESACGACHGKDGAGVAGLAPPLANAEWAASTKGEARNYLPLVILNGLAGKLVARGKIFMTAMPAQKQHSDKDIAAVANYVGTLNAAPDNWKNYTTDEIAALRGRKIDHQGLLALRAKLME